MAVGTYNKPDHTTQNGTAYKTDIDNSIAVSERLASYFAPHERATPDMKVTVDAGFLFDASSSTLTEVATQDTTTITAPTGNPRIDRIVISASGVISVVTGSEAASPSAPSLTANTYPICQILLTVGHTTITNTDITDERIPFIFTGLRLTGELKTVNDVIFASTGESEFLKLDYSANTLVNTADTNSTTDYPFTISNASNNYGMSYGAYGCANNVYGSAAVDYTMTVGGDFTLNADLFTFNGDVDIAGDVLISSTDPDIRLYESDQGSDEKQWEIASGGSNFIIQTLTDASVSGTQAVRISRTGTAVDLFQINADSIELNGAVESDTGIKIPSARYQHQETSGTSTGAFTANAWTTRELTTEVFDDIGITLSSNQLTLPAGTYEMEGIAVHGVTNFGTSAVRTRIYNVTDTAEIADSYSMTTIHPSANSQNINVIMRPARFTLASSKTIRVEYYTNGTTDTQAYSNPGINEVYADYTIRKIA